MRLIKVFISTLVLFLNSAFAINKSDLDKLTWIAVFDKYETLMANEVVKKSGNTSLKAYAQQNIKLLNKNYKETTALNNKISKLVEINETHSELKKTLIEDLKKLSRLDSKEFDEQYTKDVNVQFRGALTQLDSKFLGTVEDEKIKKHIENTRILYSQRMQEIVQ